MLARRLLCKKQVWHAAPYNCTVVRWTQSASQHLPESLNLEVRLPATRKKQPQRQPFVKNLFIGKMDHEFMYYPEPQTKDRHQQFFEWLKPIESYMTECLEDPGGATKSEVLARLRDLGVFRAHVDERYLGLCLSQTELAKLLEVLSYLPWLGSYFVKNHILPTRVIAALATDELKAKYLPRIVTADAVPAMCLTERGGLNTRDVTTTAMMSDCNTYWTLNGEKTFVVNGRDANLFLVFALGCYSNQPPNLTEQILSVLLVERDFGGIEFKENDTLGGQRDSSVCTVTFKDTKVPKGNIVGGLGCGMNVLVDLLAPGNRYVASQAVGVLRAFAKLLTTHILQRKHLDRDMHEYETVQETVGRVATKLYGMESMLYMTTGMSDAFENQDCAIENAMTEAYCANACVDSIYEGLQIVGPPSYLTENPYMRVLEDALSYPLFDSYNVDSAMYISLLGLQHTGKNLREHVFKMRNPFDHPRYIMRMFFNTDQRLDLRIAEHLHPSLMDGGTVLEKCLAMLANASMRLLHRHGREIAERQMELRRLYEMSTIVYALIAVMSRASRSYCIGLRNAEQERHVAGSFAVFTLDRVRVLMSEIDSGEMNNGDRLHKDIAALMYSKRDYFAEHPLNRTY